MDRKLLIPCIIIFFIHFTLLLYACITKGTVNEILSINCNNKTSYSGKYYTKIRETPNLHLNIFSSKTGQLVAYFNKTMLSNIYSLLFQCISNTEPCFFLKPSYNSPSSDILCSFYVSDTITVCFSYDGFISGGFVNSIIFTRKDIFNLYDIASNHVTREKYKSSEGPPLFH